MTAVIIVAIIAGIAIVTDIKPSYDFKYKATRLCLVIGSACNVKCKYCMRLNGQIREPKCISDKLKEYIKKLDPSTTEAVIINGGEPLLYMDRIKEVFSYVPKSIHKCVMTNGTLLTQEIVDYLNSINAELHFSHEGTAAKILKGVDVLEDQKIVDLLNQVENIRIYTLICKYNTDLVKNYEYIMSKLNKIKTVWYTPFPAFVFKGTEYLVDDFNWDEFSRTYLELRERYPNHCTSVCEWHEKTVRNNGFVFLPDGSIACLNTLKPYGTIEDIKEEIYARRDKEMQNQYCFNNTKCTIRDHCGMCPQFANEFTCKAQQIMFEIRQFKDDN